MNEWEFQLLEDTVKLETLEVDGTEIRVGDRVRLMPKPGGDIMDLALSGQTAVIESIEQDYESKHHVCVVLDADPGRDMGMLRQPGHRFFFDPTEIEFVSREPTKPHSAGPKVLIAGIGNIFLGDDGFGVEVVKRLLQRGVPEGVRVTDFGIRGLDLAYALQDDYEAVILVDAYPHGQEPGTVCLMEPKLDALADSASGTVVQPHAMDPATVLRLASSLGAHPRKVLLIGCEPESLGNEEGHMGLSEPVAAAVDGAVEKIRDLAVELLGER